MKKIKFCSAMISIFAIMIVSLLTYDLQANKFKEACNNDDDCDKGLKCAPVSTLAKDKICKKDVGEKCDFDIDCKNGSVCKDKKKDGWYCKEGCISEANCISDQVCRGFINTLCSPDQLPLGKCYDKSNAGKEGTLCTHHRDCDAGMYCYGFSVKDCEFQRSKCMKPIKCGSNFCDPTTERCKQYFDGPSCIDK